MQQDIAAPRISIVIPMRNEERNVSPLLARTARILREIAKPFELICVDDASSDGTAARLLEARESFPELVIVSLGARRGQHGAVAAGFAQARGEWVVTLDADLQNPPEEIPRLLEALQQGHDCVGTYRIGRQDPFPRRAASALLNAFLRAVGGARVRDLGCMLRGYSSAVAKAVAAGHPTCAYVPVRALQFARSPVEIPVSHAPRVEGRSRYSAGDLVRLTLNLLAAYSPRAPWALFALGGGLTLAGGVLLRLAPGQLPGWTPSPAPGLPGELTGGASLASRIEGGAAWSLIVLGAGCLVLGVAASRVARRMATRRPKEAGSGVAPGDPREVRAPWRPSPG